MSFRLKDQIKGRMEELLDQEESQRHASLHSGDLTSSQVRANRSGSHDDAVGVAEKRAGSAVNDKSADLMFHMDKGGWS